VKTILRIGQVLDSRASVQTAPFSPFGTALLAETFDGKRRDCPEAILVVEQSKGGPVYITIGGNPPELLQGERRVHAVFSPRESQEPVATFFDKVAASRWAKVACKKPGYAIREIDSTDRVSVRTGVALVVRTPDDQAIYCRIKKSKEWTIPETELQLGESADSAARRLARELSITIGTVSIPERVPYVNAYIEGAGHFLTLVLVGEWLTGEPKLGKDSMFDAAVWGPAGDPPRPMFVTVTAIRKVLTMTEPPQPALESIG
jgi:ADP-ribose pyrophosphatase YjhB (NUDIX family)